MVVVKRTTLVLIAGYKKVGGSRGFLSTLQCDSIVRIEYGPLLIKPIRDYSEQFEVCRNPVLTFAAVK